MRTSVDGTSTSGGGRSGPRPTPSPCGWPMRPGASPAAAEDWRRRRIIDERNYRDLAGDFHASYYSFVMRERLIRDNGHADNYVLQRRTAPLSRADENLALMDEWLTNITLESSGDSVAVSAKPEALVDACWNDDGTQNRRSPDL